MAAFWYGAEAILAFASGWPLSWRSPASWLVRDVLLPFLWARGWSGRNVVWRGNAMDVDDGVFLAGRVRAAAADLTSRGLAQPPGSSVKIPLY